MRRLLLLTALVLLGCPGEPQTAEKTPQPPPVDEARVERACSRCHAFPPADSLPRARLLEKVPEMAGMPLPSGVKPLTPDETKEAYRYYQARSPEQLPAPPPTPPLSPLRKQFIVEEFTPPGLEKRKIPAVANVAFVRLSDRGVDLLVAEMRAKALFRLRPWARGQQRRLTGLKGKLSYPCHTALADLDGDGQQDILVASLGGMDPNNERQGSVTALLRDGKRLVPRRIAEGLGRVADVRAARLDADDDLDLVVAVFGWRGPGQLLILEQTEPLEFAKHELDPRDGFIHVEPTDLDGDGDLDLVTLLSQEHEQVLAFVNKGKLRFESRILHQAPHPAWGYSGLQLVDLDADGDTDILVSNGDAIDDNLIKAYHGVSWLENTGKGEYRHHRIATMPGCERAVAGDLDGDGDLDVVAVSFLPQLPPEEWVAKDLVSVAFIERTKDGWQLHALEKHRPIHPTVDLADYDGNGKLDIAVGNYVWIVGKGGATRSPSEYVTLFTAR